MCNHTGHYFGAAYEDGCCIDGYLWDLDSDDGDGYLTSGGEIACPSCNTTEYLDSAKEDAESTSWGSQMTTLYSGAMIMEGCLRRAEKLNSQGAEAWKKNNPVINTFDWPNREAVLMRQVPFSEPVEIKLTF